MTKHDNRQAKKKRAKGSLFLRLERLREVTGKTWEKIAGELGVDRSLIYHVKAESRNLSPKVIYRLEKAEIEAGIAAPAKTLIKHGLKPSDIISNLLDDNLFSVAKISRPEIDQGFTELSLEYRRGDTPDGFPTKIKVISPSNAAIWQLIGMTGALNDPKHLLQACLPADYSKDQFLDKLTPRCYRQLIDAAMTLSFGLNWKNQKSVET